MSVPSHVPLFFSFFFRAGGIEAAGGKLDGSHAEEGGLADRQARAAEGYRRRAEWMDEAKAQKTSR